MRVRTKKEQINLSNVSRWSNHLPDSQEESPTITEVVGKMKSPSLSLLLNGEQQKETKKKIQKTKPRLITINSQPHFGKGLSKQGQIEKEQVKGKEKFIQLHSPSHSNYKSLRGMFLTKPQISYTIHNSSHKQMIKQIKNNSISLLMLIKKEREQKIVKRWLQQGEIDEPNRKRKIIQFPNNQQSEELNFGRVGASNKRSMMSLPKSSPFKINKTMSHYFRKRKERKNEKK